MARGFDSKFVEAQQEEAGREKVIRPGLSPEQQAAEVRRQALRLSRARAADDLNRATVPAHRRMLEAAITALDAQLADLEK
jgi:hypothetical protein